MKIFYLLTLLISTTFTAPIGLTSLVGAISKRYFVLPPNCTARGFHIFPENSIERVTDKATNLSNSIKERWDEFNEARGRGMRLPCLTNYYEVVLHSDQHPDQDRYKIWTREVRYDLKRFLPNAKDIITEFRKHPVERLLPCLITNFSRRPVTLLLEFKGLEALFAGNLYKKDASSTNLQSLLGTFKGFCCHDSRSTDEWEKRVMPTCNGIVSSFSEVLGIEDLSVQSVISIGNSISDVADAFNLIPRKLTPEEEAISRQRVQAYLELFQRLVI